MISEPGKAGPAGMQSNDQTGRVGIWDLFVIFFKAGLAFGGGLGILAVLEDELVSRRKAVSREDFLAIYGIGRIVPSGTMSALAVAYGYRFGGLPGTVVTLAALALPAFLITVVLTVLYSFFQAFNFLPWLEVSVLPAALGLIVVAAIKLGKDVFRPSFELVIALGALLGVLVFDINPAALLIAGGLVGMLLFRLDRGGKK